MATALAVDFATPERVALANALRQIFDDAALRSRLKSGARTARKRLRNWNQACVAFQNELKKASAR